MINDFKGSKSPSEVGKLEELVRKELDPENENILRKILPECCMQKEALDEKVDESLIKRHLR